MKVTLTISHLLDDVGGQYNMTVRSDAPRPPKGSATQSIMEAASSLLNLLEPYLIRTSTPTGEVSNVTGDATDTAISTKSTLAYSFDMTARRSGNKIEALRDAMHAYIVDGALIRVYRAMGMSENASIHAQMLDNDTQTLMTLLKKKTKPTY